MVAHGPAPCPSVCNKIDRKRFDWCDQYKVAAQADLERAQRHLVRQFDVVATLDDLESFRLMMVNR